MSFEGKTPLVLLIIVVGFFYAAFSVGSINDPLNTSLAFGKMINRVVFDDNGSNTEVVFVGDVMLARDVERRLKVFGMNYPFQYVEELFSESFVFGNFEAVVPKVHQPTPDLNTRFSVRKENLDSIVAAKFTHWSLANNHTFDFGEDGLMSTQQQLNLRGFVAFGDPNQVSSSSLTEIVVNKQKIGVIAINAVFKAPDEEALQQLIKTTKQQNDLVLVYIHWGDEYQPTHNSQQQKLAYQMIDLGADLIVGNHPHVVQDIEIYKERLIVYSLGNFLFDQYFSDEVQEGMVLKLLPEKNKLRISLVPISSLNSKIQPQLLRDNERASFLEVLAERSSKSLKEAINKGEIELIF